MYKCSKCNELVLVIPNEQPIRSCNCNATIIADMDAAVVGFGGVNI